MSSSEPSDVFNGANYSGFQDAVEKEFAANKRNYWNDYGETLVLIPLLLGAVYIVLTTDFPFWHMVLAVACIGACIVATVALTVYSFREPRIHAIRITSDGMLVLGKRRWSLSSVAEIELSGIVLLFHRKNGRVLFELDVFRVGDLESFVAAVKRQAPEVVVRVDRETMAPRLVRLAKT